MTPSYRASPKQFFINLGSNDHLNDVYGGYCVFAQVCAARDRLNRMCFNLEFLLLAWCFHLPRATGGRGRPGVVVHGRCDRARYSQGRAEDCPHFHGYSCLDRSTAGLWQLLATDVADREPNVKPRMLRLPLS